MGPLGIRVEQVVQESEFRNPECNLTAGRGRSIKGASVPDPVFRNQARGKFELGV